MFIARFHHKKSSNQIWRPQSLLKVVNLCQKNFFQRRLLAQPQMIARVTRFHLIKSFRPHYKNSEISPRFEFLESWISCFFKPHGVAKGHEKSRLLYEQFFIHKTSSRLHLVSLRISKRRDVFIRWIPGRAEAERSKRAAAARSHVIIIWEAEEEDWERRVQTRSAGNLWNIHQNLKLKPRCSSFKADRWNFKMINFIVVRDCLNKKF